MARKLNKAVACMFMSLLMLGTACCNNDEGYMSQTPSSDETNPNDNYQKDEFTQEAVVLGVDGDEADEISAALGKVLTNMKTEVTANTKLLVVPNLSQTYQDAITKVYENGGIVAVTHPSTEETKSWFEKNGWNGKIVQNSIDDALMFSFADGYHCCVVYKSNDADALVEIPNDGDIQTEDENHSCIYNCLCAWVKVMNNDLDELGHDSEKTDEAKIAVNNAMTRAGNMAMPDVKANFDRYPYSVVVPFHANEVVNKIRYSSPDRIEGDGAVGVSFDIYQIHCYEDTPNAGDYYLVNMNAYLSSERMYKGKSWKRHGGTYVRKCGLFAKNFYVECLPWNRKTNKPYGTDEVKTLGVPSPTTTNGGSTYVNSSSFSIGGGLSVSGGAGSDSGKNLKAKANFTYGFSWNESESRTKYDTEITNECGVCTSGGKTVDRIAYRLVFNNLPKFKWTEKYAFYEGWSLSYRSTSYLNASWVWYVPGAKDDSSEDPISIKVYTRGTYGSLSFHATKADLEDKEFYHGVINQIINLKNFSRERCGIINIENNMPGEVIKKIEIYRMKDGNPDKLVWSTKNSLLEGKRVSSTTLKIADKYMIYFTTVSGKQYKYTLYPEKEIELGTENTVYAKSDFSEVK